MHQVHAGSVLGVGECACARPLQLCGSSCMQWWAGTSVKGDSGQVLPADVGQMRAHQQAWQGMTWGSACIAACPGAGPITYVAGVRPPTDLVGAGSAALAATCHPSG